MERPASEGFRNARHPSAVLPRASERRVPSRFSYGFGTSFQGNDKSLAGVSSMSGAGLSGLEPASAGMNHLPPNSTANSSGPCTGTGSLATDANSVPSGDPRSQRGSSINNESSERLPSSPMSLSDNNNMSGSIVIDGSVMHQRNSSATSQPRGQDPGSSSNPPKRPSLDLREDNILWLQHIQQILQGQEPGSSSNRLDLREDDILRLQHIQQMLQGQEPGSSSNPPKKPRLNLREDDILQQQQHIQQLLQRQEPGSSSNPPRKPRLDLMEDDILQQKQEALQLQLHHKSQFQAMIQNQRCAQLQFQPQQAQMRQQLDRQRHNIQQPHAVQPSAFLKQSSGSGLCAQRLMRYMYHQHHRPLDNSILYWRNFVTEYFAPQAKKRWCLSSLSNFDNHAPSAFSQADACKCDICGAKSGNGFVATFEVLPRFCQQKFERGAIDEVNFLGMPHEFRLPSGLMVLNYAKAVQESIYEQRRVVHEGQLRIIFTSELKILSWEFCIRSHEEFFSCKLIEPPVIQLLQVAQKYQTAVTENGSAGLSLQELQTSCNMFLKASRQLARSLQPRLLNELGFPKTFARSVQISEVVNCMKDLFDFSREHKIGPIESLENYPRHASARCQQPPNNSTVQAELVGDAVNTNKGPLKQSSGDPSTSGTAEGEAGFSHGDSNAGGGLSATTSSHELVGDAVSTNKGPVKQSSGDPSTSGTAEGEAGSSHGDSNAGGGLSATTSSQLVGNGSGLGNSRVDASKNTMGTSHGHKSAVDENSSARDSCFTTRPDPHQDDLDEEFWETILRDSDENSSARDSCFTARPDPHQDDLGEEFWETIVGDSAENFSARDCCFTAGPDPHQDDHLGFWETPLGGL